MQLLIGFDIGGTKCSVSTGVFEGAERLMPEEKAVMKTDLSVSPEEMLRKMAEQAQRHLRGRQPDGIGISCGGPLDEKKGVILTTPNLPGWHGFEIVKYIKDSLGLPTKMINDANACALAEYKLGAGRGSHNMAYLTFGTGLGAGLIINNQLDWMKYSHSTRCIFVKIISVIIKMISIIIIIIYDISFKLSLHWNFFMINIMLIDIIFFIFFEIFFIFFMFLFLI